MFSRGFCRDAESDSRALALQVTNAQLFQHWGLLLIYRLTEHVAKLGLSRRQQKTSSCVSDKIIECTLLNLIFFLGLVKLPPALNYARRNERRIDSLLIRRLKLSSKHRLVDRRFHLENWLVPDYQYRLSIIHQFSLALWVRIEWLAWLVIRLKVLRKEPRIRLRLNASRRLNIKVHVGLIIRARMHRFLLYFCMSLCINLKDINLISRDLLLCFYSYRIVFYTLFEFNDLTI